jgi:hypothetical protein
MPRSLRPIRHLNSFDCRRMGRRINAMEVFRSETAEQSGDNDVPVGKQLSLHPC